jgi:DNA primase
MAILEEDIVRVRQAVDLVEVVQEHVGLRKVGRRWTGLCPFHAEKSPSFSVNGEEGFWYCFGCHAKGDVITFVREVEHIDFVEAVERLAARASIEIHFDNTRTAGDRKHRQVLVEAMEQAVEWYHQRLLNAPDAKAARAYLRERGYDGDVVRQFKIGWAPEGWDELAKGLKLPENVLKGTGLGFVNRRGRAQDAFRARVLFPIFDAGGSAIAIGGRILPGGEGPKYKNSSETPLYAKSRTLYALNWAKGDVVTTNEVVVCEGYTDVIGFFTAGVPRAVATCGTALTEEHVRTLKNFASRVVLAYDADSAGQAAADRFYEWERKLGIDIVVAELPKGADPADLARRDPELLKAAVQGARPFLQFRIERALQAADLRTVEGRARVAESCLQMITEHPNELVRDQYLMVVADRCRVPIERLRTSLSTGSLGPLGEIRPSVVDVRSGGHSRSGGAGASTDRVLRVEWEAIRVAIQQPEDVAMLLDKITPASGVAGLEDVLFDDDVSRAAFGALIESPTFHDAIASAEPEASDLLGRLSVEDGEGNAADEFLRLVDRAASRYIRELEVRARVSPAGLVAVGSNIAWLKLSIEQLRSSETEIEAAASLLAWLADQSSSRTAEPVE